MIVFLWALIVLLLGANIAVAYWLRGICIRLREQDQTLRTLSDWLRTNFGQGGDEIARRSSIVPNRNDTMWD